MLFCILRGAAPLNRLRIAVRLRVAFQVIYVFLGPLKLVEVLWKSGDFRPVSFIRGKIEGRFAEWSPTIEDTPR